jgi:hypothetical protein
MAGILRPITEVCEASTARGQQISAAGKTCVWITGLKLLKRVDSSGQRNHRRAHRPCCVNIGRRISDNRNRSISAQALPREINSVLKDLGTQFSRKRE